MSLSSARSAASGFVSVASVPRGTAATDRNSTPTSSAANNSAARSAPLSDKPSLDELKRKWSKVGSASTPSGGSEPAPAFKARPIVDGVVPSLNSTSPAPEQHVADSGASHGPAEPPKAEASADTGTAAAAPSKGAAPATATSTRPIESGSRKWGFGNSKPTRFSLNEIRVWGELMADPDPCCRVYEHPSGGYVRRIPSVTGRHDHFIEPFVGPCMADYRNGNLGTLDGESAMRGLPIPSEVASMPTPLLVRWCRRFAMPVGGGRTGKVSAAEQRANLNRHAMVAARTMAIIPTVKWIEMTRLGHPVRIATVAAEGVTQDDCFGVLGYPAGWGTFDSAEDSTSEGSPLLRHTLVYSPNPASVVTPPVCAPCSTLERAPCAWKASLVGVIAPVIAT